MIRIRFRRWRRWLYRRVVKLRGSPHAIARGMALGVIFGNLMPPGLQLFTASRSPCCWAETSWP